MFEAYHETRKMLDMQLGWIRMLQLAPYRDKSKQISAPSIGDFVLFSDTAEDVAASKRQTPEQQLAFVQNFLHPHFEARAELEAKLQKEGAI